MKNCEVQCLLCKFKRGHFIGTAMFNEQGSEDRFNLKPLKSHSYKPSRCRVTAWQRLYKRSFRTVLFMSWATVWCTQCSHQNKITCTDTANYSFQPVFHSTKQLSFHLHEYRSGLALLHHFTTQNTLLSRSPANHSYNLHVRNVIMLWHQLKLNLQAFCCAAHLDSHADRGVRWPRRTKEGKRAHKACFPWNEQ